MSLNPGALSFNPSAAVFVPGQFSFPAPPPAAEDDAPEEEEAEATVVSISAFKKPATPAVPTPEPAAPAPVPAPAPTPAPTAPAPKSSPVAKPTPVSAPSKEEVQDVTDDNDDELTIKDDPREHLSIVFIGHVDAGKSTISGQILFSTGMVDARTIEKYEREAIEKNRGSWFLAYILDTNEEERAKGKTVEVGRAHFATEKKRYTIMDAPGHKAYVPNMIQGVAQADVGILVISARKGEFEAGFQRSGQTREHAILAKTLGIRKLIIAVNKFDEVTVNWDKGRYDEIVSQLSPFLKSIGYSPKDTVFLPISGFTGLNLTKPLPDGLCPWYSGPTVLEILDNITAVERSEDAPLRIPVLDKYRESGKVYILGKVEQGILRTGDKILLQPGNVQFEVSQIQNDMNVLTYAKPGENVRIVVRCSQVDEDQISKGCVVQGIKDATMPVTDEFVAQIQVMELLEHKSLLTAGYQAVCHMHTATEEVVFAKLLDELDPKTGLSKKKLPKFIQSKSAAICHFKLARPIPMEKFSDTPQLGRFTLRDEGKTLAFGKILATNAPIKKLKTAQ